jgi:hypothetical protein
MFGAMNQINHDLLFTHHFTTDMNFVSNNEKIKCFRVMDEEGRIVNKDGHEKLIPEDKLKKMYQTMVTINEADQVFNAAQR